MPLSVTPVPEFLSKSPVRIPWKVVLVSMSQRKANEGSVGPVRHQGARNPLITDGPRNPIRVTAIGTIQAVASSSAGGQ